MTTLLPSLIPGKRYFRSCRRSAFYGDERLSIPYVLKPFPVACRMAVTSRAVLSWSRPVTVSRRLTGVPAARLADRSKMRRSPPEQGSSPERRAVMAASQPMSAIGAVPSVMLVPVVMKRLVKSSRCRNVPLAMSSSVPASSG